MTVAPPQVDSSLSVGGSAKPQAEIPKLLWPLIALLAIILLNFGTYSRFTFERGQLHGSLVDVFDNAAPVMLVALGMTLVIATGGIDLSVGAVMAISGTVAALLITRHHGSVGIAIAAALAIALAAGALNGLLVALFDIQPLVATLVLMVAGRGVAQLLSHGQTIPVSSPAFDFIGGGYLLALPFTLWIVAAALLLIGLLARRTAAGLFIESVGSNPIAARYAGVNARAVKLAVYTLCGLCAGIAGLIAASDLRVADANSAGLYIELDAILAVVIGGTALAGGRFSLIGAIIGALIVQAVTTTILTRGLPVQLNLVVKAVVVVAVALLQSEQFRRLMLRMVGRRRA